MFWVDAAVTLGGLIVPPVFDFIKKKFIKETNDTPERTIGTLATTKPEVLSDYVNSLSEYLKAQAAHFNRDVIGTPSLWVVDLRAGIRPAVIVVGLLCFLGDWIAGVHFDMPTDARYFFEIIIGSWFGSRVSGENN